MNILGSNEVPAGGPVLPNPAEVPAQGAFAAVLTGKLEACTGQPVPQSPTMAVQDAKIGAQAKTPSSEGKSALGVDGRAVALLRSKATACKPKNQKGLAQEIGPAPELAPLESLPPVQAQPLKPEAARTQSLVSALPLISIASQSVTALQQPAVQAPPTVAAKPQTAGVRPEISLKALTTMPVEALSIPAPSTMVAPVRQSEAQSAGIQPMVALKNPPLRAVETVAPGTMPLEVTPVTSATTQTLGTQAAVAIKPQSSQQIELKTQAASPEPLLLENAQQPAPPSVIPARQEPEAPMAATSATPRQVKARPVLSAESQPVTSQPVIAADQQPVESLPIIAIEPQPIQTQPAIAVGPQPLLSARPQPAPTQPAPTQPVVSASPVAPQPVVVKKAPRLEARSQFSDQAPPFQGPPVGPRPTSADRPLPAQPSSSPQPLPAELANVPKATALPVETRPVQAQPAKEALAIFQARPVQPLEIQSPTPALPDQPGAPLQGAPTNPLKAQLDTDPNPARANAVAVARVQSPVAPVPPQPLLAPAPASEPAPTSKPVDPQPARPEPTIAEEKEQIPWSAPAQAVPLVQLDNLVALPLSPNPVTQLQPTRQPELLQLLDTLTRADQPGTRPVVIPFKAEAGVELARSPGLLERLQEPVVRSVTEQPKVVVGNFQQTPPLEAEAEGNSEPSPALPGHLVSLAVNLLKQQPTPGSQPLRQEILQRLQSAELLGAQPTAVPATSVVLAQVEKIQVETLQEQKPRNAEIARVEGEETPSILPHLESPSLPAATPARPQPESAIQVPDAAENIQRLARQQGKALIDKPRELDVHLRSERLGDVAAHLKVNPGGGWTAHVQLRDSQVEQSVRQELNQLSESRGLEGFTTSLSQDSQEGRGSFQGFSFHQEQQPRPHFGQGDLERRQRTYQGKSSSQASTSVESLPIDGSSSVHGTQTSSGLNVRA